MDGDDVKLSLCQGSRLVKNDGFYTSQSFHVLRALNQDTLSASSAYGGKKGQGYADDKGAGAADDEKKQSTINPHVPLRRPVYDKAV